MFDALTLLGDMPDLTVLQYSLVDNIFSMTVATMGAAALFFFMSRSSIGTAYRPALMVSGIVVSIACYHYFMIRHSWQDAYTLTESGYAGSGAAFNDFYRYADWILTVPLLLVELVIVMRLAKAKAGPMLTKLVIAAAAMIALGYPGEVISSPEGQMMRLVWGGLSCLPFFYILYVLWVELTKSLDTQPQAVRGLINLARYVILITWLVYPIAYGLGSTTAALEAASGGNEGAGGIVGLQIGYAIADMTAKAGFGVLIYFIARAKTQQDAADGISPDAVAMPV
ncbi:MAG: bacteriorhodopsin [Mariniblastus sp.]|jgi:bacteriorhodopsin